MTRKIYPHRISYKKHILLLPVRNYDSIYIVLIEIVKHTDIIIVNMRLINKPMYLVKL